MIKLVSDAIKIAGPRVDGSYTVTLSVGEYQSVDVAKLLAIPQNTAVEWTAKPKEDHG